MRPKIKWLIVISCLLNILLPASTTTAPHVQANQESKGLSEQLDSFIRQEPLFSGAIVGVSVRNQQSGEILYDHLGSTRLRPASNLKLLTAASALEVLGENHRFSTKVYASGTVKNGVLHGNLYIQGGGDPSLQKSDLRKLAQMVKKSGIKKITGQIIGDDTRYDDNRYSFDMPWSDEEAYYGAEISALTVSPDEDYDAGTLAIEIAPAKKAGEKVSFTVEPENNYITIKNIAVTSEKETKKDIMITRKHGTNQITISGQLPMNASVQREWVAIWNVSKYTVHLFKEELSNAGVKVGGYQLGVTPSDANLMGEHQSIPLSQLLIPFMKLSNNSHGELLMKEIGKVVKGEGSFENGLSVMRERLSPLGVEFSNQIIRDGSGISHVNLIQPHELTELLFTIQSKPWFSNYYRSLPVAGTKEKLVGGTLRYRMKEAPLVGNVVAKTGTITTVSSISGYVKTKTKGSLIFSILINNVLDEEKAKKVEDQMISILANQ